MTSARSLAPPRRASCGTTRPSRQLYDSLLYGYASSVRGHPSPKLFVVLAEKGCQFPRSFRNTAENLVVKRHTSHIMTKKRMVEWIRECVLPEVTEKMLLIVDSWPSFRDHELIQSLVSEGKSLTVKNIPGGAICPRRGFRYQCWESVRAEKVHL